MFASVFMASGRGAPGHRWNAAGGAMAGDLVGGDAAMIELEQLVTGYGGGRSPLR